MSSLRTSAPMVVSNDDAASLAHDAVADLGAVERAPIDLLDLVAVDRIAQKEREVREQVEAIRPGVGQRAQLAALGRAQAIRERDLVARGVSALVGIERAEARDQSLVDGARRDLARPVPVARVAHLADADAGDRRRRPRQLVEQLVAIPVRRGFRTGRWCGRSRPRTSPYSDGSDSNFGLAMARPR